MFYQLIVILVLFSPLFLNQSYYSTHWLSIKERDTGLLYLYVMCSLKTNSDFCAIYKQHITSSQYSLEIHSQLWRFLVDCDSYTAVKTWCNFFAV